MANVDLQEPSWYDSTVAGVQRWPRNCGITPGAMDSVPTASADYAGAILYTPGATLVRDAHTITQKDATDAYINRNLVGSYLKDGISPAVQFTNQNAAFTLQNVNTAQNCFATDRDVWTVSANTSYAFEMLLLLTTGATSHTTSMTFTLTTATLTSINYVSMATSSAADTLAAPQMKRASVATVIALTAASTAVQTNIFLKGIIRVNAAGSITPQLTFSADPTGTCTTDIDSYFMAYPIGSKTVTFEGLFA